MQPTSFQIVPLPGYAPAIGRLVGMLAYARATTLKAVDGLSVEALDHLQDPASNSIGALLAHATAVERAYQVLTFEERVLTPEEERRCAAALNLGDDGRRELRGHSLDWYLGQLAEIRAATLRELATRTDEWLEQTVTKAPAMNNHWAWFHVAEDEINHRGQIRWLRARLPRALQQRISG